MTMRLAPGIELPESAITQTFGILAKRGAGKSNTGAVMAEEMFKAGLPFVVVDPVGAWWGLRSSSDGKSPGLPIPIFGGHRGDVPLEQGGAELVADLIVEERVSCVLDVSAFESEGLKRRFLSAFAERLFRRKGQPGFDDPLHLFLEEADDYAPQRAGGVDVNRTLGAFQRIVKQGRARGLGSTMITQRSAVLNKDLLTQIETLIVMRTTAPNDRKAIAAWVEYHGQSAELLASLHELKDGEAWVWSPWLELTKRVQVRRRATFDSGATPSTKGKRAPATLADIDLGALRERMSETIEKAKAEDPRELKKTIREQERTIKLMSESIAQQPKPEPVVERVEVPMVPEGFTDALTEAMKLLERLGNDLSIVGDALSEMRSLAARVQGAPVRVTTNTEVRQAPVRPARTAPRVASEPSEGITAPQQRILDALAWLNTVGQNPAKRTAVGLISGYSHTSGGFNNLLGALRTLGLIDYPQSGYVALTDAGAATATALDIVDEHELREMVYERVGGPKTKLLRVLVAEYPTAVSRDVLGERTGYSPTSGGFNNLLGSLRTVGLIDYPQKGLVVATDALFLEGR